MHAAVANNLWIATSAATAERSITIDGNVRIMLAALVVVVVVISGIRP